MDELREEPVAENTTVNKPEIMREIYARVYRGSLFCYVLLIAGGAVFLSFKPLAGLISGGRFDSKLTVIEIVAGAVVVAAGILGLVSMLANRKKRGLEGLRRSQERSRLLLQGPDRGRKRRPHEHSQTRRPCQNEGAETLVAVLF